MFEFNKDTEWILGRPNFWCASTVVPLLRKAGRVIPFHAEEEQAAAIYWMLQMYEKHGTEWREKGIDELRQEADHAD